MLLCAAFLALAAPARAADPVGDAYAAYEDGEYERAVTIARGAVVADPSITTLVAAKVLVLSLVVLDELDAADAELDRIDALPLLAQDRDWVVERRAEVATRRAEIDAAQPEPVVPDEPVTDEPVVVEAPAEPGATVPIYPKLLVSAGARYQRLASWDYGAASLDLAGRIAGVVWFEGGADLGVAPSACPDAPGEVCASLLTTVAAGVQLRFQPTATPGLRPFVAVGGVGMFNGGESPYRPATGGGRLRAGVELAPGRVAPRLVVEGRLLAPIEDGGAPLGALLVGLDATVRIGTAR